MTASSPNQAPAATRPKLKPDEIAYDGSGIFFIGSRSHPDAHRVDICEWDGLGSCECQNYIFNIEDQLRKGFRSDHLRCYHVRQVHKFVVRLFTDQERAKRCSIKHPRN